MPPAAERGVAAHLIVGRRDEPFLPALLASLDGVADRVLVNDNSGLDDGPNQRALRASAFARDGRLTVDRAPFVDFSSARNRLLDLHARENAGAWVAFVDADDVHRPVARRIAARLDRVDPRVAVVDGYTRHYLQSFRWYFSVERRMAFFRFSPALRWEGAVHEHLRGLDGASLVLPYVYDHYGWVLPLRFHAHKARIYHRLGDGEPAPDEGTEAGLDPVAYFAPLWPRAIRFRGAPPPAAEPLRAAFERDEAALVALVDRTVPRFQPPATRLRNAVRAATFAYRWRGRALDPRARALMG